MRYRINFEMLDDLDRFLGGAGDALTTYAPAPMLTPAIHNRVETLAASRVGKGINQGQGALFTTEAADFMSNGLMSALGLVSRVSPVQTALRNCTRDEGRSFEVGNQVLISSHRKLLLSKAMVVNVAEKSGQDSDRQG
jgi:hypothetical protein